MWEPTTYKNKAQLNAAKRAARKKEKERQRVDMHIQRTDVELRLFSNPLLPPQNKSARMVLNDFQTGGVQLFMSEPIDSNTRIALAMQLPLSFFCRGMVVGCLDLGSHPRVLSAQAFRYRITIKFEPETRDDAENISAFYRKLREIIVPKSKKGRGGKADVIPLEPPAHYAAWKRAA